MNEAIEVAMHRSAVDNRLTLAVTFESQLVEHTALDVFRRVVDLVAERYVQENFSQIAAKLDQNAIANLAIAEASKKIAEEIQRQPNIVEKTKTEVYQRGVLGGMRRIR